MIISKNKSDNLRKRENAKGLQQRRAHPSRLHPLTDYLTSTLKCRLLQRVIPLSRETQNWWIIAMPKKSLRPAPSSDYQKLTSSNWLLKRSNLLQTMLANLIWRQVRASERSWRTMWSQLKKETWTFSSNHCPTRSVRLCTGILKSICVGSIWMKDKERKLYKRNLSKKWRKNQSRSVKLKTSQFNRRECKRPRSQSSNSVASVLSSYPSTWRGTPTATNNCQSSRRKMWQYSGWSSSRSLLTNAMETFKRARRSTVPTWWTFQEQSPSRLSEAEMKKMMKIFVPQIQTQSCSPCKLSLYQNKVSVSLRWLRHLKIRKLHQNLRLPSTITQIQTVAHQKIQTQTMNKLEILSLASVPILLPSPYHNKT